MKLTRVPSARCPLCLEVTTYHLNEMERLLDERGNRFWALYFQCRPCRHWFAGRTDTEDVFDSKERI